MSRCFICNYSDMGLSDIPIDDRIILNDICSICDSSIHPKHDPKTVGEALEPEETEGEGLEWPQEPLGSPYSAFLEVPATHIPKNITVKN